jgi:hypothetical protein
LTFEKTDLEYIDTIQLSYYIYPLTKSILQRKDKEFSDTIIFFNKYIDSIIEKYSYNENWLYVFNTVPVDAVFSLVGQNVSEILAYNDKIQSRLLKSHTITKQELDRLLLLPRPYYVNMIYYITKKEPTSTIIDSNYFEKMNTAKTLEEYKKLLGDRLKIEGDIKKLKGERKKIKERELLKISEKLKIIESLSEFDYDDIEEFNLNFIIQMTKIEIIYVVLNLLNIILGQFCNLSTFLNEDIKKIEPEIHKYLKRLIYMRQYELFKLFLVLYNKLRLHKRQQNFIPLYLIKNIILQNKKNVLNSCYCVINLFLATLFKHFNTNFYQVPQKNKYITYKILQKIYQLIYDINEKFGQSLITRDIDTKSFAETKTVFKKKVVLYLESFIKSSEKIIREQKPTVNPNFIVNYIYVSMLFISNDMTYSVDFLNPQYFLIDRKDNAIYNNNKEYVGENKEKYFKNVSNTEKLGVENHRQLINVSKRKEFYNYLKSFKKSGKALKKPLIVENIKKDLSDLKMRSKKSRTADSIDLNNLETSSINYVFNLFNQKTESPLLNTCFKIFIILLNKYKDADFYYLLTLYLYTNINSSSIARFKELLVLFNFNYTDIIEFVDNYATLNELIDDVWFSGAANVRNFYTVNMILFYIFKQPLLQILEQAKMGLNLKQLFEYYKTNPQYNILTFDLVVTDEFIYYFAIPLWYNTIYVQKIKLEPDFLSVSLFSYALVTPRSILYYNLKYITKINVEKHYPSEAIRQQYLEFDLSHIRYFKESSRADINYSLINIPRDNSIIAEQLITSTQGLSIDSSSNTQSTTGVPATGVSTTGVPATGVPATGVPATGVPATGVPATTEPATTEPATGVPATTEPATGVPATTEPATTEPATTEPATGVPATGVPATTEPATTEPATGLPDTLDKQLNAEINTNIIVGLKHIEKYIDIPTMRSWEIEAIKDLDVDARNEMQKYYDFEYFAKMMYVFINRNLDDLTKDFFEAHCTAFMYTIFDESNNRKTCGLLGHATIDVSRKYFHLKLLYILDIINPQCHSLKVHYGVTTKQSRSQYGGGWFSIYDANNNLLETISPQIFISRHTSIHKELSLLYKICKKIYILFFENVEKKKTFKKLCYLSKEYKKNFQYSVNSILSAHLE